MFRYLKKELTVQFLKALHTLCHPGTTRHRLVVWSNMMCHSNDATQGTPKYTQIRCPKIRQYCCSMILLQKHGYVPMGVHFESGTADAYDWFSFTPDEIILHVMIGRSERPRHQRFIQTLSSVILSHPDTRDSRGLDVGIQVNYFEQGGTRATQNTSSSLLTNHRSLSGCLNVRCG